MDFSIIFSRSGPPTGRGSIPPSATGGRLAHAGALLAVPMGILRNSRNWLIKGPIWAYIYFFRGTHFWCSSSSSTTVPPSGSLQEQCGLVPLLPKPGSVPCWRSSQHRCLHRRDSAWRRDEHVQGTDRSGKRLRHDPLETLTPHHPAQPRFAVRCRPTATRRSSAAEGVGGGGHHHHRRSDGGGADHQLPLLQPVRGVPDRRSAPYMLLTFVIVRLFKKGSPLACPPAPAQLLTASREKPATAGFLWTTGRLSAPGTPCRRRC